MKQLKPILLALFLCVSSSSTYAADPAGATQGSEIDPEEVNGVTREHLKQIFIYSQTLPREKQSLYTDVVMNGGFMLHMMKKGFVKPEQVNEAVKQLEKMYEGDNILTEKEAHEWLKTVRSLANTRARKTP